jgi:hypothetical protein
MEVRAERLLQFRTPDAAGGLRTFRGRVIGERGPIAGAAILVTSDDDPEAFSNATCPGQADRSLFDCECPPVTEALWWRFEEGRGEAAPMGSATTAADGTFAIGGLPEGRFAVWASAQTGTAVALGVDGRSPVELRLSQGHTYEGVIEQMDGGGIADALVGAVFRKHSRFFLTKTDSRGRYRIRSLPEGDYALIASANGFEPKLAFPQTREEFRLGPVRRAAGLVTLNGKPMAGVQLHVPVFCGSSSTVTDANGRFVLDRLRAERTLISARIGNYGGYRELDLKNGDQTDILISLEEGGSIEGAVRSTDGKPVAAASITVSISRSQSLPEFRAEASTDSAGLFVISGLPPAEYSAWLTPPPGYLEPAHRFVHVERLRVTSTEYVLGVAGAFSGRVVDDQGQPLTFASISGTLVLDETPLPADWDASKNFGARTNREGRFALDYAPPGRLRLKVTADGFIGREVEVNSPGTSTITLSQGGKLRVEVTSQEGTPAARAYVIVTTPDGDAGRLTRHELEADADGTSRFDGLAPGKYRVTSQLDPSRSHHQVLNVRTIATDATVSAGEVSEVRLQFAEGVSIKGLVVDAKTGKPIEGAFISATDKVVDPPPGIRSDVRNNEAGAGTRTSADGRFSLDHLRPNQHELSWAAEGYELPEERLVMPDGKEITLSLRQSPRMRGRVLKPTNEPVTDFMVNRSKVHGTDGRFDLQIDGDGSTVVVIEAAGFARFRKRVTAAKGSDVELGDLTLEHGRDVRVRVMGSEPGHRPIDHAEIEVGVPSSKRRWDIQELFGTAITGPDGWATIPAVPAQPLHVLVSDVDIGAALVPLPAEARELTVTLEPTGSLEGTVRNQRGEPIRNLEVGARSWSLSKHKRTNAEGRYIIEGLPSGEYSVVLEDGAAKGNYGLRSRQVVIDAGKRARTDFSESTGSTVTVNADKCARVFLARTTPRPMSDAELERLSSLSVEPDNRQEQRFVFRGLGAATYSIVCLVGRYSSDHAAAVRIEVTNADLTLSPDFLLVDVAPKVPVELTP